MAKTTREHEKTWAVRVEQHGGAGYGCTSKETPATSWNPKRGSLSVGNVMTTRKTRCQYKVGTGNAMEMEV